MSSFQIELTPSLASQHRRAAQHLARSSRPARHHRALRRPQGAPGRGRAAAHRRRGRRLVPRHLRAAAPRQSQLGRRAVGQRARVARLVRQRHRAGQPGAVDGTARRVRRPGRSRAPARPPQHPECAGCQRRLPHCGRDAGRGVRSARHVPRPAASTGGDRPRRPHALHQRQQGDQCRQRSHGAGRVPRRHPLDHRRQAQGGRHRQPDRLFPAHRQGLPDRPGDGGVRRHARGQSARSTAAARSMSPSPRRPAMRLASSANDSGRAAVAGLCVL